MKWRNWKDTPPQLPHAPIMVRLAGLVWMDTIWGVRWIGVVEGLEWTPLGIYREEFWQTTGRWI